ncbi:uncharacterized protein LOC108674932 [Hyalella azteca]|uniref:Uncharacterized protein LOC108674932 n=1 Tax=Hyalella azteca TaxID=294128 RepID=A0A8B7NXG0_HYAAZ|nr:uncharacterized protein LOC108674932 [Hyalella azteca]
MPLSCPARSMSLDGLHLVHQGSDPLDGLSASAESLRSGLPLLTHRRSADAGTGRPLVAGAPGIVVTPPPLHTGSLKDIRRKNEVSRAAWEVASRFERRSHAARQLALRNAAILHMRKNSTALKVTIW